MPTHYYPTGGGRLRSAFYYLREYGFLDFLLPVLLLFTLFFAILQKVAIFTTKKEGAEPKPDKKVNGILSFALALMITIPHTVGMYPVNMDPIVLIGKFLPNSIIMLVVILVVLLLLGFVGQKEHFPNAMMLLITAIAVGILVTTFLANMFPNFLTTFGFLRDPSMQAFIIVLLVMGLVGYWIMRPEKTKETTPQMLKRYMLGEQIPPPRTR